jgi:enterochelin esterase family protein
MRKFILSSLPLAMFFSLPALPQPRTRLGSPVIDGDGRVSFRFRAPNALRVEIQIEGQTAPVPMRKDKQGVWTAVAGPLAPDFYGYSFVADEVGLIDPSNPLIKPNLLDPQSMVHVPGPASLPWEANDVPHGEIHHHFYRSKIAGEERDLYVYTPPGFDPRASVEYPVLYLLHGFSDDASGWTAVGRAHVILDNLISQQKAKPMIVVMPLAYGDLEVIRRGWGAWADKDLSQRNLRRFSDILLREVLPLVENSYRVQADRDSRAIAGLSMGGTESLLIGLNHLDQFRWVGAFSAGGLDLEKFDAEFPQLDRAANAKLKLLWIACGTDDRLIAVNRQFKVWLQRRGIGYEDVETPGMHTWMLWRRNLGAFLPLLFH